MLKIKQVKDFSKNSFKSCQLFTTVTIIGLASVLGACGDQASAPSNTDSEKPSQESVRPIPPSSPSTKEQSLTTSLLQEKGATRLSTTDILELIVDNSIVFEHLGTGEFFEAIYKKDGRRLLTSVDSGSLDDETLHDAYVIKDNKLQTKFKGQPITSTIYKLDQRYLAAVDSDNGVVNYEIRDIVKAPLTVALLKSQKAKMLSSEEITQLFVGNRILIKDLITGDEYIGLYADNGIRTLQYINPLTTAGSDEEMKTSDSYKISNSQLHSSLDGNEIATTIFKLDTFYYGALSIDDGAVNFEFVPQ